ncbi:hypothetical protein B0H34DRAFT_714810 [Crassisporium funariophilum]|nr:hypothetical protein B0H34DRAFT_714810 [Crassisporium funariophilum]
MNDERERERAPCARAGGDGGAMMVLWLCGRLSLLRLLRLFPSFPPFPFPRPLDGLLSSVEGCAGVLGRCTPPPAWVVVLEDPIDALRLKLLLRSTEGGAYAYALGALLAFPNPFPLAFPPTFTFPPTFPLPFALPLNCTPITGAPAPRGTPTPTPTVPVPVVAGPGYCIYRLLSTSSSLLLTSASLLAASACSTSPLLRADS